MLTRTRRLPGWMPISVFCLMATTAAVADFEDAKLTASDGAIFDHLGVSLAVFGEHGHGRFEFSPR
jgi:hypothetical protein